MTWLLIPVVAVVITYLWWLSGLPSNEFDEVTRRERAMKALGKRYDPEQDTALRRSGGSVPDEG